MPVIEDNQGTFQYPTTMTMTPIRGTIAEDAPPVKLTRWAIYTDRRLKLL